VKIFISHSHQDSQVANALVDMLLSGLSLEDSDIRCTSVPGHQLELGKNIAELLKTDISQAPALIALVSEESLTSNWVMFELGAAWGLERRVYPILGPNMQSSNLPGSLANLTYIEIESPDASSRTSDLLQQLAQELSVESKSGGKARAKLDAFLMLYKKSVRENPSIGKQKNVPISDEDSILLAIWGLDENEYVEIGYLVKAIAEKSGISIPKCEHIFDALIRKKYITGTKYMFPQGCHYKLEKEGRNYLLEQGLVK
jgi:TIR domain